MKDTIVQGLAQAYGNLVHMIADFLPRFVVMLTIILVGLLVAFLLKVFFRSILHLTKLDRLSEETGASHVLRKAALPSMSEFLSRSVFWITLLGFILLGISVLQVPELQEQISRLFQLLPQIFVAILILFVGMLAANFLSRATLLTAVNAGYRTPRLWSGLVRFVISILAVSMALEQVGDACGGHRIWLRGTGSGAANAGEVSGYARARTRERRRAVAALIQGCVWLLP
jgi:hypothetical protein